MAEHVILFAGPMGAGKSTAIRTLSDVEVVTTEAANTDRETADKATTTVALDYGEILISDEEKVRLYGVPGQKRFDFMWSILRERAEGMVLLVHADAEDPAGFVVEFLREFAELANRGGVVVGVTRHDVAGRNRLPEIVEAVTAELPDRIVPVMSVDARDRMHLNVLLMSMIANVEAARATA